MMHENSKTVLYTVAPECIEAVVRLSREITRRTELTLKVTEFKETDFILEGSEKAVSVEAVLASRERDDSLAGCNVIEDVPEEDTYSGGTVTSHYLRNLQAIARNPSAARAVLEKLERNPGKGGRKRSSKTTRSVTKPLTPTTRKEREA